MIKNKKIKKWAIAIGYVLLIYATLGVVRAPLNYLRSIGILTLVLYSLYGLCFGFLLFQIIKSKQKRMWETASLIFIFFLYYLAAQKVSSPEEQIHFLQYGLVGVFFLRALSQHWGFSLKSYAFAFALSGVAGWLDEVLQGLIPTRYYDIKDIFLNIYSSFLGLLIYKLVANKSDQKILS